MEGESKVEMGEGQAVAVLNARDAVKVLIHLSHCAARLFEAAGLPLSDVLRVVAWQAAQVEAQTRPMARAAREALGDDGEVSQ